MEMLRYTALPIDYIGWFQTVPSTAGIDTKNLLTWAVDKTPKNYFQPSPKKQAKYSLICCSQDSEYAGSKGGHSSPHIERISLNQTSSICERICGVVFNIVQNLSVILRSRQARWVFRIGIL